MPGKLVDFDAYRAEQAPNQKPLHFQIGGQKYAMPPSLPAIVAVDLIRLRQELKEEQEVPPETLDTFGLAIFGEEVWRALLSKHRITLAEVPALIELILTEYSASDPTVAGEEPKEEAPRSPRKRSSSTSSKAGR